MKRCRARKITIATTKEEVVSHEHEESNLVRSKLDRHIKSNPPTHYLEFSSRETQKLYANVVREMALFSIN